MSRHISVYSHDLFITPACARELLQTETFPGVWPTEDSFVLQMED